MNSVCSTTCIRLSAPSSNIRTPLRPKTGSGHCLPLYHQSHLCLKQMCGPNENHQHWGEQSDYKGRTCLPHIAPFPFQSRTNLPQKGCRLVPGHLVFLPSLSYDSTHFAIPRSSSFKAAGLMFHPNAFRLGKLFISKDPESYFRFFFLAGPVCPIPLMIKF